jgi:putative ABC transport system permease protein
VSDPSAEVVPLLSANGDPNFHRDVRLMAMSVGLLGLLVLLVACTNVSALLTGLATARRHEIATRLSLGATRLRVLRQLLTESIALAVAAAVGALGLVWVVLTAVDRFLPFIPLDLSVSAPAVLFAFGIALPVGVLFGLSPALHASRLALARVTRDSAATIAPGRGRLQRGLVVAQIALTQPLIVLLAAVLVFLVGSYGTMRPTPDADRIATLSLRPLSTVGVRSAVGPEARQQLRRALGRIERRITETPGVESVVRGGGLTPPLTTYAVHPDDRSASRVPPVVNLHGERAEEEYFRIMGMPLVRGRHFEPGDEAVFGPRSPEAPILIGDDLARTLWGTADPIGRRLLPAVDTATVRTPFRVVGVYVDPRRTGRGGEEEHTVYFPPDTAHTTGMLLVRTAGPAAGLAPTLRAVAQEEASTMVAGIRTIADMEAQVQRNYRIISGGIIGAGLIALFLSALGLYAVISFSVGQRLREIAVRIAMGGRERQIVRQFVVDGLRLGVFGLLIGLPLSVLGLYTLDAGIGEVSVSLPAVTAIAAVGVLTVALAAVWLPARRAAAVDPAVTLRGE